MTSQRVTGTQVEARYRPNPELKLSTTLVEVLYVYSPLTPMTATTAAIGISGVATPLYKIKQLVATPSSYALAGSDTTLRWLTNKIEAETRVIAVGAGSAELNWLTFTIRAQQATFAITPSDALLIAAVGKINAGVGSFSLNATGGAVLSKPMPVSWTEQIRLSDARSEQMKYKPIMAEMMRLIEQTIPAPVIHLLAGVGVGSTLAKAFRPGAAFADTLKLLDTPAVKATYGQSLAETVQLVLRQSMGIPFTVTDQLGIGSLLDVKRAVSVAEQVLLEPALAGSARYGVALTQAFRLHDDFRNFFAAAVSERVGFHTTDLLSYRADGRLAETIGLDDALTTKLLFRVTANEAIQFTDAEALSMIFSGTISDTLQITAAYVSPQGTFTTWAVNVVNNAVTEYDNYQFNSFARFGNRYLGANDDGIWLLEGPRDDTTNILAKIRSGFAQFANGRLNGFKGAYVAVRGQGEIILRLITADGRTYHYKVTTNNSMLTTKVEIGKGLRARYFAFELETHDFDFDLDSVEFVPMMATRRV